MEFLKLCSILFKPCYLEVMSAVQSNKESKQMCQNDLVKMTVFSLLSPLLISFPTLSEK